MIIISIECSDPRTINQAYMFYAYAFIILYQISRISCFIEISLFLQLEAALIVDAVQVISEAINLTVKSDPHFGTKLNRMLKTPGHADCFTKPSLHQITPREHVLSNLKKVRDCILLSRL